MKGIGTLSQPTEPFWSLTPPDGQARNPLKFHCSPNESTPDYIAYRNVEQFLAYGLVMCWDSLDPEYFSLWNMVDADHLDWLRSAFLDVFQAVALGIYDGLINRDTKSEDFDPGDWVESISIGDHDSGDEDEFCFIWFPHYVDENSIAIVFHSHQVYGKGNYSAGEVIWIRWDAFKDRKKVYDAFKKAHTVSNNPLRPIAEKRWLTAIKGEGKKIRGKGVKALCDQEEVKEEICS